jgi:hypothetical protein
MKATAVAQLLRDEKPETGNLKPENLSNSLNLSNHDFLANRSRATEEAPSFSSSGLRSQVSGFQSFAQQGAAVERTADGFTVTVTGTPPGKQQRVEVEIPWTKGMMFDRDQFLSLEYRLRASRPE